MSIAGVLICAMAFLLVVFVIIIIILARSGSRRKQSLRNTEASDRRYASTAKLLQDNVPETGEYEKTVPLAANRNNASQSKPAGDTGKEELKLEAVPKLTDVEKTQILSSSPVNSSSVMETTVLKREEKRPVAILKVRDCNAVSEYAITSEYINIGRDPEMCSVVIEGDNFVGKHHALIFKKGSKFYVVDINSKNGTFINQDRVEGCREITNGCNLKFANTEAEFIVL